ncbi:uncharacterized protein AMSG_09929 [Thecamonas trahens ATCC 50062]|uniref:Uncharacterized protein n=1 Tax=Thecamonas trahens ATCC 50062 TaxID=461836 RepID=A0A0L0DPG4_THETB|nr:hypothetical protein AMSG_09929 [Thecamonas trahens ATCC 50062]KNC54150.1 hypothetical protein AMSG_09929 [Thecamonas trahens ATCC 50062]|eukprot:XP_013753971.1 hypothetical protein AMSG_09929 [Thecamonas trahens ATCC 50062]
MERKYAIWALSEPERMVVVTPAKIVHLVLKSGVLRTGSKIKPPQGLTLRRSHLEAATRRLVATSVETREVLVYRRRAADHWHSYGMAGHSAPITGLMSCDGALLTASNGDSAVRLTSMATGKEVRAFSFGGAKVRAHISTEHGLNVLADATLMLYDVRAREVAATAVGLDTARRFVRFGDTIFVGGSGASQRFDVRKLNTPLASSPLAPVPADEYGTDVANINQMRLFKDVLVVRDSLGLLRVLDAASLTELYAVRTLQYHDKVDIQHFDIDALGRLLVVDGTGIVAHLAFDESVRSGSTSAPAATWPSASDSSCTHQAWAIPTSGRPVQQVFQRLVTTS